jgi:hypothetical protein
MPSLSTTPFSSPFLGVLCNDFNFLGSCFLPLRFYLTWNFKNPSYFHFSSLKPCVPSFEMHFYVTQDSLWVFLIMALTIIVYLQIFPPHYEHRKLVNGVKYLFVFLWGHCTYHSAWYSMDPIYTSVYWTQEWIGKLKWVSNWWQFASLTIFYIRLDTSLFRMLWNAGLAEGRERTGW